MGYMIETVFGSLDQSGQPLSPELLTTVERSIVHVFSELFGGAQIHRCSGGYKNASGEIVEEPVTIIRAYSCVMTRRMKQQLIAVASFASLLTQQECVLLLIFKQRGNHSLITPAALTASLQRNLLTMILTPSKRIALAISASSPIRRWSLTQPIIRILQFAHLLSVRIRVKGGA